MYDMARMINRGLRRRHPIGSGPGPLPGGAPPPVPETHEAVDLCGALVLLGFPTDEGLVGWRRLGVVDPLEREQRPMDIQSGDLVRGPQALDEFRNRVGVERDPVMVDEQAQNLVELP